MVSESLELTCSIHQPLICGGNVKFATCDFFFFVTLRAESTRKEIQEMQADGETDQSTTSFMRNTMVSSTMVSGEASETDDEDEDEVGDNVKNVKEDAELEAESKLLKEKQEFDTEIHEFELETGAEVKAKRQKIVYKFDS